MHRFSRTPTSARPRPEALEPRLAPAVVAIDAAANVHAIDPNVYGTAFASTAQLTDLRLPLNRNGGNASDTYSFAQDATNHGSDWYFESIAAGSGNGQGIDSFVSATHAGGARPSLTLNLFDWAAKLGTNRSILGSFSVAKYGAQQATDPYNSNWGNGVYPNNSNVTGNDPNDAYLANSPSAEQTWIQHLIATFGNSQSGGVKYYTLGNEPGLWNSTHRDIHPNGDTLPELRDRIISYAAMVKALDPGAQILGPEEWGWTNYFISGADAAAHNWNATYNGMNAEAWLLDQLRQHDAATGQRLLDYFTLHFYPQGGEFGDDVSTNMELLRNRSTRSLWDPNYVDESWIANTGINGGKVNLINMMKNWVHTYYPGTKIGLTEYNWGAEGNMNGATTQADIWGIFGREGLNLADRWTTPAAGTPTYLAMKMFRNYDGNGSAFGDTSVSASVANPDQVSAFSSVRSSDGALTVMVVNKNLFDPSNPSATTSVTINLSDFANSGTAQEWQLAATNPSDQTHAAISHLSDLHFGGNSVTVTVPMESVSLFVIAPVPSVPQPADSGFEAVGVGTGSAAYRYAPTGSAWSFSGTSGVSGNGSVFTASNPAAPQGSQVAFLQQTGSFSQTVAFPAAGTYVLSFSAAQRANGNATSQALQVKVDGSAVGTFTPAGSAYATYTTASFTVSAGSHTIAFAGTNPNGGDNTAFLDQVAINPSTPQAADAGFEEPGLGTGNSAYRYAPAGSSWTFSGTAGLAGNGSVFTAGNPAAPQGTQVAFVQGTGSLSQSAGFAAGTYSITFGAAQRGNFQASSQTVQVTVDGAVVATVTPSGTAYAAYTTPSFPVAAGAHTIAFAGTNPNGGDNTALIDQVAINVTGPALVSDAGFEAVGVGTGSAAYRYDPSGSAWTFSGSAGLAGNGSVFTSGNPVAPQGSQVAFLQQTGALSQAVNFAAAGTYALTFSAAQRANSQASSQSFRVTVDGTPVGTFTPSGAAYATYTTASFTVSPGSHTIAFAGTNPNGGDNTALLDQVAIVASTPQLADAGFEGPGQGIGSSAYRYDPSGSSWTFSGTAGLAGNGSAITAGNPAAPQGTQVAFVQGTGSLSQSAGFAAGTYSITFGAAQRGNFQASSQTIQVTVDGTVIGTFTPSGTAYAASTTALFNVTTGAHTIAFAGLNPNGGDNTALIDQVEISPFQ